MPQDLFTRFLERFPNSYLDHHGDFRKFTSLLGRNNRLTTCGDETLLILNLDNPAFFLSETFAALSGSCLKNVPVVVLMPHEAMETIRECYHNHVASVIVVSPLNNNYERTIENIFDFWLSVCKLPKTQMPANETINIKNSLDDDFFKGKRN